MGADNSDELGHEFIRVIRAHPRLIFCIEFSIDPSPMLG